MAGSGMEAPVSSPTASGDLVGGTMKSGYMVSCALAARRGGAPSAPNAATVDATAATTAESSAAVADIVVTATRRDETIQNVPMTVQAFTTKAISQLNINTLDDILKYTPNVTFGNNGPGQGVIFMRGLSAGLQ